STEHMDTLYDQLLELEKQPNEKSIIEEIFRAAHTLKGMSATMGFDDLAQLTHKLENIFDGIRYDKIQVQTEMIDHLFHAVDASNNDENNPVIKVDEFQLTILGESQEQGFEQYEISVHLSEDCLLKGARVYMIFELLEKMGEVVQTDPAVQDLEEEKFDNSFK